MNGDEKEMTWYLVKYLGDDQGMVNLEHPADTHLCMHTQQVPLTQANDQKESFMKYAQIYK